MSPEETLVEDLAALTGDPLRFVQYAFPWGEPGSELENAAGPEPWQIDVLTEIRDGLLTPFEAIQIATASGHGVGKSALVSWIILWAISTFEDTRGVVTANTEKQLVSKTWAELSKWFRLFIGKAIFKQTATRIVSIDPEHENTWRIDMIPWSENNTEAFAGLHNQGKRIIVVFDEASAIPDVIWETTEGALTDANTQILWIVCGNPTRNTGRFRECFEGRRAHRWKTHRVDSRAVGFSNHEQIRKWIEDYGDDSDFVRVRIKGTFPRQGSMEFISAAVVDEATKREVLAFPEDPLVIGVDVARYGDDESVLFVRKGRDARSIPYLTFRGLDTMSLAGRVAEEFLRLRADSVFVDGGGVGGGVVDRLRQLQVPVWDVQFGGKADRAGVADDKTRYANKRAEMWGFMREWLKTGSIPDDPSLSSQLISPQYSFNENNEIILQKKQDMKRRGLDSPDRADALALTFAYPVIPNQDAGSDRPQGDLVKSEYDPFDLRKEAPWAA